MIPIVYSKATGRVRRWAVADKGETQQQLIAALSIGPGEDFVLLDEATYAKTDGTNLQDVVSAITGLTPKDDRFVVVQGSAIVNVIMADPAIDPIPQGVELVPHDKAEPGWTYVPLTKAFIAPVVAQVPKLP